MPEPYWGNSEMFGGEECYLSHAAVGLRDKFRLLWEQHVYWTRIVIIGITFDLPELEASTARLLRNVPDFARVLECFYNRRAVAEFSRLLKEHLVIAAELVKAAKAGDKEAAADAERRWYKNADEIACLTSKMNPYWEYKPMRKMWFEHLKLTKAEAVAEVSGDYAGSIKIFDKVERLAMVMADEFSSGIICQFCL